MSIARYWWKLAALILLLLSVYYGLTTPIPKDLVLLQTMRNVFFHAPMWFAMMVMYTISFVYAIKNLNKTTLRNDAYSTSFARLGVCFNILGVLTGMLWARVTWNTYWNNDPKLIGAAVCLLLYLAYFVLRQSVQDEDKKAKIASVYNVFAYFLVFPCIYILPGILASSHPGGGGDAAFMVFKMQPTLRLIFYPACIGWILVGVWVAQLRARVHVIQHSY